MKTMLAATVLLSLVLLTGCAVTYRPGVANQSLNTQGVHVPPGQMPPPGQCRIWYKGRPPGQQPPPGNCSDIQASEQTHFDAVDELTWEYLVWAEGRSRELYGMEYDIAAAHERDIVARAKYLPPMGRLLLASVDGASAGCVCLQQLGVDTGEVKRLYVRPSYRGHGVGRELLQHLIQDARDIGYQRLVLDSGGFQQAAHALYRQAGFVDIAPYQGNELPERYRQNLVFMELPLTE
ncbi:MAG: GNAT family N-acetyltransferase [Deinococcales bacterium]